MGAYRDGENDNLSFPGKIAIITSPASLSEDDFFSPKQLLAKFGTEKVIHLTGPENYSTEQGQMINTVASLAGDMEIKILIINQAAPGTNAALSKFKETRDDVFIILCTIHEPFAKIAGNANLIFESDRLGMGEAMVKQTKKQGAKVFVHYSFPRHMSMPILPKCRDAIRKTCKEDGIQFVDVMIPDPASETGLEAARQFVTGNVSKQTSEYGEDTAFFCTSCKLQPQLIRAVVDHHAIYPQPCCPSPSHGFPEAFGIKTSPEGTDLNSLITEISRIAAEKNMSDRLSTWPVSTSAMFTNVGAEYAIKRLRGEAPARGIDDRILEDCIHTYVREVVGEGVEATMTSYYEKDVIYNNFKLILMSYLDF